MKLIKINPDHFIIVDDSEIKEGDWVLQHNFEKTHNQIINIETEFQSKVANNNSGNYFKRKITHSTQPLEFEDVKVFDKEWNEGYFDKIKPLSLQEVKELIGEVDVEKKILDLYNQFTLHPMESMYPLQGATKRFIEFVYNQAIKDNKEKKYTEEDMIIIFGLGAANRANGKPSLQEAIQSIQPKTQWNVTFNEQNKLQLI